MAILNLGAPASTASSSVPAIVPEPACLPRLVGSPTALGPTLTPQPPARPTQLTGSHRAAPNRTRLGRAARQGSLPLPPLSAATMAGRQTAPAAPPEGRAWWLELQRQRAQAGSGAGSPPAAEGSDGSPEGRQGDDALARRRASLLRDSEALLRRMSRPSPQPSCGSVAESRGASVSAAAAAPPACSPAAAPPPPLQRRLSTRCASLTGIREMGRGGISDVQEINLLLEGGMIG